jgi:hypothetical protein
MPNYQNFQANNNFQKQRYQSWEPAPRPLRLEQLDVRCLEHPRPEPMLFIGWGTSNQNRPMAIYACKLCNYREAYVEDHRTGQPFRLFFKLPR